MSTAVSPLAPSAYPELPPVGGVRFATAQAGIKYAGRTDVLMMVFDEGADVAGAEDCGGAGVRVRLLSTLLKRCSDKLPSVRAKALAGFASALQHPPTARQVLVPSVR